MFSGPEDNPYNLLLSRRGGLHPYCLLACVIPWSVMGIAQGDVAWQRPWQGSASGSVVRIITCQVLGPIAWPCLVC